MNTETTPAESPAVNPLTEAENMIRKAVAVHTASLNERLTALESRKRSTPKLAVDLNTFPVGKPVSVKVGRGVFNGTVVGVDTESGKVTVLREDGKTTSRPAEKVGEPVTKTPKPTPATDASAVAQALSQLPKV